MAVLRRVLAFRKRWEARRTKSSFTWQESQMEWRGRGDNGAWNGFWLFAEVICFQLQNVHTLETHTHTINIILGTTEVQDSSLPPSKEKENITIIISHFYWYWTSVLGLDISSDKPFYFEFLNLRFLKKRLCNNNTSDDDATHLETTWLSSIHDYNENCDSAVWLLYLSV